MIDSQRTVKFGRFLGLVIAEGIPLSAEQTSLLPKNNGINQTNYHHARRAVPSKPYEYKTYFVLANGKEKEVGVTIARKIEKPVNWERILQCNNRISNEGMLRPIIPEKLYRAHIKTLDRGAREKYQYAMDRMPGNIKNYSLAVNSGHFKREDDHDVIEAESEAESEEEVEIMVMGILQK